MYMLKKAGSRYKKKSVKGKLLRNLLIFALILLIIFAVIYAFFAFKSYFSSQDNGRNDTVLGKVTMKIDIEREPRIVRIWKSIFGIK